MPELEGGEGYRPELDDIAFSLLISSKSSKLKLFFKVMFYENIHKNGCFKSQIVASATKNSLSDTFFKIQNLLYYKHFILYLHFSRFSGSSILRI